MTKIEWRGRRESEGYGKVASLRSVLWRNLGCFSGTGSSVVLIKTSNHKQSHAGLMPHCSPANVFSSPFLFFSLPVLSSVGQILIWQKEKRKKKLEGTTMTSEFLFEVLFLLKKCLSWQIISFPADIGHSHNSESNLPPSLDLKTVSNLFLRNGSHPSSVAKLGPHFHHILVQCVMEKRMKKMQETVEKKSATRIMFCGYVTITTLYNLAITSSLSAGLHCWQMHLSVYSSQKEVR